MSSPVWYRWTGDVALCTQCGSSGERVLLKGSRNAALTTRDANRLALEIGDCTVDVEIQTDAWQIRKSMNSGWILVFHKVEIQNGRLEKCAAQGAEFYLFRFGNLEQSNDFQLYLEVPITVTDRSETLVWHQSTGTQKTATRDEPVDQTLAEMIKGFLSDPAFHDYVHQVERVWDHVASEMAP